MAIITNQEQLNELKYKVDGVIRDLEKRRDAHAVWRDCSDLIRASNPGAGTKGYHEVEILTLENNIEAMKEVREALVLPPVSADVALRKFFITFMENVYPDVMNNAKD